MYLTRRMYIHVLQPQLLDMSTHVLEFGVGSSRTSLYEVTTMMHPDAKFIFKIASLQTIVSDS